MAIVQEQHHGYYGYYEETCPRCKTFKLKVQKFKQMLSCKTRLPTRMAETTSLWLKKEGAVALRQAKSLKIHCYECKENEGVLEWYQCLYKMSKTSIKNVQGHKNSARVGH